MKNDGLDSSPLNADVICTLDDNTVSLLKDYTQINEHKQLNDSIAMLGTLFRNALSAKLSCSPDLLILYNGFLKLRETSNRHFIRKEKFLFPVLSKIVESRNISQGAANVFRSFIGLFKEENEDLSRIILELSTQKKTIVEKQSLCAEIRVPETLDSVLDMFRTSLEMERNVLKLISIRIN